MYRTCLQPEGHHYVLGYLFCIFTAPALMVSPEVHANQGRGAVVFSAGFWRAADGDTLWSDHLEPIWWLLLTQKEGAAVKPQISQTAWWREKAKKFTIAEDTLRDQTLGKTFHGHTFIPWKRCKRHYTKYIDTLEQTHWHTCRPLHNLMHANAQTAWG